MDLEGRSEREGDHGQVHDLIKLEQITLESVLDCLIDRFHSGIYYTLAGSVLISLNPCEKNNGRKSGIGVRSWGKDEIQPHVYSVGRKCSENLFRHGGYNQVIVVSGDSGAGKTTATQQLLCYFIERNDVNSFIDIPAVQDGLEQKIYCATQILEAFGNASTVANPNSSRFGRLVQILYGTNDSESENRNILGAQVETCLLEKHRVAKCASNERNFHIFYYVLVAIQQGLFNPHKIPQASASGQMTSLIPQYFEDDIRSSDSIDFTSFYNSIQTMNMISEVHSIFEIIYGIMMTLKLDFASTQEAEEKENNPNVINMPQRDSFHSRLFRLTCTNDFIEALERILKIDFEAFEESLVARNFCAGKRKSSIRKPCESIKDCRERLSAFVTTIYDKLFSHLLQRLNYLLGSFNNPPLNESLLRTEQSQDVNGTPTTRSISLLDLYGFENLNFNHLEQLCINYANERLQQVHIAHLKNEILEGNHELGGELHSLDIFCRVEQQMISRIDSLHRCVFSTLDETCVLNRPQSDSQVFSQLVDVLKNNDFIRPGKLLDSDHPFLVKHYANTVTYSLRGMVDKNKDYVPPEFLDLLQSSENPLISSMFSTSPTIESKSYSRVGGGKIPNHKRREKTILQRFKASVDSLVNRLEPTGSAVAEEQDIHFIRCIRPNSTLEQGKIERKVVEQQLYSCGIVDVIRITGNGFPIRITFSKFHQKFSILLKRCCLHPRKFSPGDESLFNLNSSQLKFGNTQIFMTEETWEFFIKLDAFITRNSTRILQRYWKQELLRRRELLLLLEQEKKTLHEEVHANSLPSSSGVDAVDNLSLSQIETSLLLNHYPSKITKRKKRSCDPEELLNASCPTPILHFNFMVHTNERRDIVSRRCVYNVPIRFYVKKTPLSNSHLLPRCFLPQGIMDAID